ncbi:MAG TPA: kelch repeat-containing protein [Acidobacteriota bacterium]|nr:kelch repeat-containing protein [Acidobacteriota bacterium]
MPSSRNNPAMAYDSERGVVVLSGGDTGGHETWEWNGSGWTLVGTTGPGPLFGHAIAYDSKRGRMVLFGGHGPSADLMSETWIRSSRKGRWRRVDVQGPFARSDHKMVFDSKRSVVVLFGGKDRAGYFGDTWEWDGASWTKVSETGPTPRYRHAMAYHAATGKTVLFGGYSTAGYSLTADTWVWNGKKWRQLPATGPSPRMGAAMAYDDAREVTVLLGGMDASRKELGDTWEFNGHKWRKVSDAGPKAACSYGMAYDAPRGKVIAYGGSMGTTTWFWNGVRWSRDTYPWPPAVNNAAMVWDENHEEAVLFGGQFTYQGPTNQTWLWDGDAWSLSDRGGKGSPEIRLEHALVYESTHKRVVLYGGAYESTWAWGQDRKWIKIATSGPGKRYDPAMAFDAVQGVTVLFGGSTVDLIGPFYRITRHGDTWMLDGSTWTMVSESGPDPREGHAMAFDESRGVVVLFGGFDGEQFGDTWEWDGSQWSLVSSTGPAARVCHQMVYNRDRGRVVLFGGVQYFEDITQKYLSDVWEWDGSSWKLLGKRGIPARYNHAMAYDPIKCQEVVFGGIGETYYGDTWLYGPRRP